MEGWKDGRMEGWKDGRMEGWRDGGMEGWRDEGMEGWRDGGMEISEEKERTCMKESKLRISGLNDPMATTKLSLLQIQQEKMNEKKQEIIRERRKIRR